MRAFTLSSCHQPALDRPRRHGPANMPAWPAILVLLSSEHLILLRQPLHYDLARGSVELWERRGQFWGGVGRELREILSVDLLIRARPRGVWCAEPADILAHNQRIGVGNIQNGQ